MNNLGFVRIAVCSPKISVGNPRNNYSQIASLLDQNADADIVVFPELCVTGYTCGDLFRQEYLLQSAKDIIHGISAYATKKKHQLVFVGAPYVVNNELFNCAFAINNGKVIGIVPKTNIPNYSEFYESRWFRSATGDEPSEVSFTDYNYKVPFGIDLLFKFRDLSVFAEICEDLWMPIPPSSFAAIHGANVLVNLSASNETVGKNEYRVDLVKNQSARCIAAYAYASAGPSESTSDLVFGGHCIVAENGKVLAQTQRVGENKQSSFENGWYTSVDVDIEKLQNERRTITSFGDSTRTINKKFRNVEFLLKIESSHDSLPTLKRQVDGNPFVPENAIEKTKRCAEVFEIQCAGLHKRLEALNFGNIYIGVSGGLDSTLALLVAAKTYKMAGVDVAKIHGITLPGFGTTSKTKNNALALMSALGISQETIDIRPICLETFKALKHKSFGAIDYDITLEEFEKALKLVPKSQRYDLVFENVQARERTKLLMSRGFVLGTGDLSEAALGWCTYNGDHMSMYNVNCSVPKTLVRSVVDFVARRDNKMDDLFAVLTDILDTTISPELLPPNESGEIEQSTEDVLGPYELHDFYLANFVKNGFSPEKILYLSEYAKFSKTYSTDVREKTLKTFLSRFFSQQYKRNCVPDGPKVGSVSLSPRGDWRMPSDADPSMWFKQ
jgi:NAD+ synthase (glutamine-hydrolysing)